MYVRYGTADFRTVRTWVQAPDRYVRYVPPMGDVPVRTGEQFEGSVVMRWAPEARPVPPGEAQTFAPFPNLRVEAVQNVGAMELPSNCVWGRRITSIRNSEQGRVPPRVLLIQPTALATGASVGTSRASQLRLAAHGHSAHGGVTREWQGCVPKPPPLRRGSIGSLARRAGSAIR